MFNRPNSIIVFLNGETVGRLALTSDNLCAFEYDPGYLANGKSVSPFYLPLNPGVFVARRTPFSGN